MIFFPDGPYHYTSEVYHDKVHHLATVISEIGTDLTPDGLSVMGCAKLKMKTYCRTWCMIPYYPGVIIPLSITSRPMNAE